MKIQENIDLKKLTTFKIGGYAKYFCVVKNTKELNEVLDFVKKNKIKFFILGGGSNLLFSDKGFNGLVIKIQNTNYKIKNKKYLFAESGLMLNKLANFCCDNGLSGFEWAAGIPGTLGGAIYGNAQAFGSKISQSIKEVSAFDIKKNKIIKLNNKQCDFSLKNSIFKKNNNLIILSAVFILKKGDKERAKEKINEFLHHRRTKHPLNFPSAGSVFVNLEQKIKNKKLLQKYPELVKMNKEGIILSGFLIEKCGLKGKKIGGAQISEKHANFIINVGGARALDVLKLIDLVKKRVQKKFNIKLETEIKVLK